MTAQRVLAIVGSDRSGSTVLDNILGGIPGVCSAGEIRYLWERGIVEQRRCGCGVPVPQCPLWAAVMARVPAATLDAATLVPAFSLLRTRHLLTPALPLARRGYRRRLRTLARAVQPLYHALGAVTGAELIVDSSKRPTWVWLLAEMEGLDVRVVHLVRDPRAVAHSRKRFKLQLDSAQRRGMSTNPPAASAAFWTAWNLAAGHLRRRLPYLRLRYEDLIADPLAAVDAIGRFAGLSARHPALASDHVVLAPSHTVSGNPSRFAVGRIELRLDDAWRRALARSDRWVVDALTAPLARAYGYGKNAATGHDGER